ncbi:hypothetical protein HAN_2g194 (nucleomorph) [Hemiselmis andersenii]|uniref:Uncharacterized protein n=1 Tax=Hemiselmis andersenii TaxID=464988 RepID=A9BKL7_HEMAN|nr:hypothetical protein HAN_2g194 [Hemiselmis andersenii]ABW98022.1 hypothetical protein HAN_2g194 [Hemiselmis andersenii]
MEKYYLKKKKIKNSFFFLIAEKFQKKISKNYFQKRSIKNFYISESAWKILKIVFKNFILKLAKSSNDKTFLNKRTKFNSSDLIENFKIQKYFSNSKEIFERSPIFFDENKSLNFSLKKKKWITE